MRATSKSVDVAHANGTTIGYTAGRMPIGRSARASIRLGVVILILAAFAGGWELLARQAPGSPLYIGMLPGPVAALRELSLSVGLLLVGAGLLMPWAAGSREPWILLALLGVGALMGVGGQVYGAIHGMYGVQLMDLREDALGLFVVKQGGLGLLSLGLCELGRRVLFRPPPQQ